LILREVRYGERERQSRRDRKTGRDRQRETERSRREFKGNLFFEILLCRLK
jgi:hypothetical protein